MAVIFIAACGGDDEGSTTPSSVAGTYNLQTVNGNPLPFVDTETDDLSGATYTFRLNSSNVVLGSSGSFSAAFSGSFQVNSEPAEPISFSETGTFSLFGSNQIRLIATSYTEDGATYPQDPDTTIATISANAITVVSADTTSAGIETWTFVYRKP